MKHVTSDVRKSKASKDLLTNLPIDHVLNNPPVAKLFGQHGTKRLVAS